MRALSLMSFELSRMKSENRISLVAMISALYDWACRIAGVIEFAKGFSGFPTKLLWRGKKDVREKCNLYMTTFHGIFLGNLISLEVIKMELFINQLDDDFFPNKKCFI